MTNLIKITQVTIFLMKEYKILIVDDYPEHIMVITEILLIDSFNYQILAAPNGKVALEIAKKKIPHLIIMD
jgi:CheY-like chemotaxis protein